MASTIGREGRRAISPRVSWIMRRFRAQRGFTWMLLITAMGVRSSADAADFTCAAEDVQCIVDTITAANTNEEANTLTLAAGTYTFTTPYDGGLNALPVITGTLVIQGVESATILSRGTLDSAFRLLQVAATAHVILDGLVIQGFGGTSGMIEAPLREFMRGGAILNDGILSVMNSTITGNRVVTAGDNFAFGGGIYNAGTLTIQHTSVTRNVSSAQGAEGGGITNTGSLTLEQSSLTSNATGGVFAPGGAAISNRGRAVLINSTVAMNTSTSAAILSTGPSLVIRSSTIADNAGGLRITGGDVSLQNSIVAHNTRDCSGAVTSHGNNIIGDLAGCTVTLQGGDIVGDPLLGDFWAGSEPGTGHYPLLPGSPAIDAGGQAPRPRFGIIGDCPARDQIGQTRLGPCDIGAIEFRPPTLGVSPRRISAGETVAVTWSGIAAPTATDWIGFYYPGTDHAQFLDWAYVSCTQIPDRPLAFGSCSYTIPSWLAPARYELRLLANDQFSELLATTLLRVE